MSARNKLAKFIIKIGMTLEGAAKANCETFAEARRNKATLLERLINESSATRNEKSDMHHTLSKLGIFAADERDQLTRLATNGKISYYGDWLARK